MLVPKSLRFGELNGSSSKNPLTMPRLPALSSLVLVFLFTLVSRADVVVSEFVASNQTGLVDEDGDTPDWIELHNNGAGIVSLAGWALTDSAANLAQWIFPAVTIEPNGFMVVFASSKNRAVAGGVLHTNFKLSSNGGYLALVRPDLTKATGSIIAG